MGYGFRTDISCFYASYLCWFDCYEKRRVLLANLFYRPNFFLGEFLTDELTDMGLDEFLSNIHRCVHYDFLTCGLMFPWLIPTLPPFLIALRFFSISMVSFSLSDSNTLTIIYFVKYPSITWYFSVHYIIFSFTKCTIGLWFWSSPLGGLPKIWL